MLEFADLRRLPHGDRSVRLGVLGDPVAHSRSPDMMNAALRECGFPHRYCRFHIRPGELRAALELMRAQDFVGVNLTAPHKIAAMSALDYVDETAAAVGAVNTIAFRHGKLRGSNTDTSGFADAIREAFAVDVRSLRVVILGAGGASRAIAAACRNAEVWSRQTHSPDQLRALVRDAELIVNATPVGLSPDDAPLLDADAFRAGQLVFDTIYEPSRTRLLLEAEKAGARVANGLGMLLHQGAKAFEIWFNRPAPIETMRAALGSASELA